MPADQPTEPRRQGFARIVGGLLWAFTLAFVVAAVQVGRALWSHRVWMNYRGEVVSLSAMRGEMIFFSLGAIFCALLAWHAHRTWRRRPT